MVESKLYKTIDSVATNVFRRAKHYRKLGQEYDTYCKEKVPEVLGSLKSNHASYLEKELENYENRAYLEVQGELSLIQLDIAGFRPKNNQEKANKAAFANGLLWYAIKLIDHYVDERKLSINEADEFLQETRTAWRNQTHKPGNSKKARLINATTNLLYSGFLGDPQQYKDSLSDLCESEITVLRSPSEYKLKAAQRIGVKSAVLSMNVIQQYFSEYPNKCKYFLIQQGIGGKMFDDWKDYVIDREKGNGYDEEQLPELKSQFFKHFFKQLISVPGIRPKWRNANFLILGGLFQLREIMGQKERS